MKKTSLIMIILGLIIVGAVIYFLTRTPKTQPNSSNTQTQTQQTSGPVEVTVNYNSADKNFTPQTYKVQQGQQVALKVTSDIADELHFHGYDLHTDLESGKQGEIDFTADKTGQFEFELESRSITLGAIEVDPK